MNLSEFIKKGLVRKSSPDRALAKSLFKTAKEDLEFLKEIKINLKSSRKLTSNYYDVLRSLLEVEASLKGYKIYSHEAFTKLLEEDEKKDLAQRFDRQRKIRNAINYYGKSVSIEETKDNIKEMIKMINYFINKYKEDLK